MPTMKKGAKGNGVKYVQQLLNKNGAKPKLEINGVFDETMRDAVKAFQKRQGFKPDGIVGDDTMARLEGKPTKLEQKMAKYKWGWENPNETLKTWDKVYLANYNRAFDEIPKLMKTTKDHNLKVDFEMDYKKLSAIVREHYSDGRDVIQELISLYDDFDIAKYRGDEKQIKSIQKKAGALMKTLYKQEQGRDYGIEQQDMRIKRFKEQVKIAAKKAA